MNGNGLYNDMNGYILNWCSFTVAAKVPPSQAKQKLQCVPNPYTKSIRYTELECHQPIKRVEDVAWDWKTLRGMLRIQVLGKNMCKKVEFSSTPLQSKMFFVIVT